MPLRFSPAPGAGTISLQAASLSATQAAVSAAAAVVSAAAAAASATAAAASAAGGRTTLSANRTYYVNGNPSSTAACYNGLTCQPGSDSNDGLSITSPFWTPQKAWTTVANKLDLNGFVVTIQLANGDGEGAATGYNAANNPTAVGNVLYAAYTPPGVTDINSVIVQGNLSNSDLVILKGTTSSGCYFGGIGGNANVFLQYVKIKCTSGDALICGRGATVEFDNVNFGTCGGNHITAFHGANVYSATGYKVSGNATFHAIVQSGAFFAPHGATITYSNNPVFTINFYASDSGAMFLANMTFTNGNTVTGVRAFCTTGAYISTSNLSLTYLPGSTVPTVATGGQYDTLPNNGLNEVTGVLNNATYNATTADYVIEVVNVTAARTVNLPAAAGFSVGRKIIVVDVSGLVTGVNKITATPNGTDTINGANAAIDLVTAAWGSGELFSTGSAWVKFR